jgi:hypothetical protein
MPTEAQAPVLYCAPVVSDLLWRHFTHRPGPGSVVCSRNPWPGETHSSKHAGPPCRAGPGNQAATKYYRFGIVHKLANGQHTFPNRYFL